MATDTAPSKDRNYFRSLLPVHACGAAQVHITEIHIHTKEGNSGTTQSVHWKENTEGEGS